MSLVKAKDVAYETACLEKRIQFVRDLKSVLGKNSLISQTVDLYTDLIEDILYDVCLDVHRDIVMGVERDARGAHRQEGQGRGQGWDDAGQRSARRSSVTTRGSGSMDSQAGEVEKEIRETREGQSMGERKRQARPGSPPGGRPGGRRRVEAPGAGKGAEGVQPSAGEPAEAPTLEEMVKQAALHYGSATMLGVQMSGSKGAVDMFGNMIQPVSLDLVACPNCTRKVSSGRFAPHLEKCMGGGRQSHKASRSYADREE